MKTKETSSSTASELEKKPKAKSGGRVWRAFVSLCNFLILGALATGIVYVWDQVRTLDADVSMKTEEIESSIERQTQRNKTLDAGISVLRTTMDESRESQLSVVNTVGVLSEQIAGLTEDVAGNIANLANEQKSIAANLGTLEETGSRQGKAIGAMEARMSRADEGMAKLARETGDRIAVLTVDLADHDTRINRLGGSFTAVNETLQANNAALTLLGKADSKMLSELAGMRGGMADQQSQIAGLSSGFAEAETSFTGQQSRISGLASDFAAIRGDIGGQQSQISDLASKFADMRGDFGDQQSQIADLVAEFVAVSTVQVAADATPENEVPAVTTADEEPSPAPDAEPPAPEVAAADADSVDGQDPAAIDEQTTIADAVAIEEEAAALTEEAASVAEDEAATPIDETPANPAISFEFD